ncbi:phenylalanine ammonia-lyase [Verticillium alfalfae VaMs.102]|uniref:Phenylalanine ammonia-lyase n=1 Tax=Verticillium alfalfae (strain VaMs.102 / ATCC MYA-4576 / FGSC 10136) TaxID=526221 RepID=C9SPE0_VERA1|nr:phenylalanine ammonia-lyase [Verticillium alfalfae VaMs.102]EEY20655.1 phenylalanine ammonia-lyase [Verticillium alfalfae VaMs.102]
MGTSSIAGAFIDAFPLKLNYSAAELCPFPLFLEQHGRSTTHVYGFTPIALARYLVIVHRPKAPLEVGGGDLTIADVVAVSRHLARVALIPASIAAIEAGSKVIPEKLTQGEVIYGVNTGFGGTADVRSDDVEGVQQSLISHLTCGIVADGKTEDTALGRSNGHAGRSTPRPSVIAVRTRSGSSRRNSNENRRGHRIPRNGALAATRMPRGKTSATAFSGRRDVKGARRVTRADAALSEAGIAPIGLLAKEGLAIVNGTAVSAGVAALAAHESLHLAALSQVLTAMSVEALRGSDESFEPFIARVRPHPGQTDSARNIKGLPGRGHGCSTGTTAATWRTLRQGPLLAADGEASGSAPCSRTLAWPTSWGLPPNLCSDDAGTSFLFKGLDVVVAALASELGFLANPVGSHVQTAEMGNQSLNSLALVSARYTLEAVDVLSQMASAQLLALCQALDLRAIEIEGRNDDALPPNATPYIGQASRRMYRFVRKELGIPFLAKRTWRRRRL